MKEKKRERKKTMSNQQWIVRVFLLSVFLSALLSLFSTSLLDDAGYLTAVVLLLFFILLGIFFDIVGVAVTAADPKPFHAMAAHKEKGAKEALFLLRSADKVSNFCNDVVGDVCGIVSGTTSATIVMLLRQDFSLQGIAVSIIVTALISGMTIGGKAVGKRIAIERSTYVVHLAAKILNMLHLLKK